MLQRLIAVLFLLTICRSDAALGDDLRVRTSPPATRPAKLDRLRAATDLVLASAVTHSIERKPAMAEATSYYFREVGRVFASAETNVDYSAIGITAAIYKVALPLEDDGHTETVRTLILTLYSLAYEDRTRAEVPPIEWLSKICVYFRNAINNGLKDTGRVGI